MECVGSIRATHMHPGHHLLLIPSCPGLWASGPAAFSSGTPVTLSCLGNAPGGAVSGNPQKTSNSKIPFNALPTTTVHVLFTQRVQCIHIKRELALERYYCNSLACYISVWVFSLLCVYFLISLSRVLSIRIHCFSSFVYSFLKFNFHYSFLLSFILFIFIFFIWSSFSSILM